MSRAHPLRRMMATQSHQVRSTAQVVGGDPSRESGVKKKTFREESKAKRKQKEIGDKRPKVSKSTQALTQAISECAKETRWQDAIMLYASNTNAAGVASFNATMKACQKGTQWQLSTDLLHQITLQKPKPDTISYNTAIDSCKKGHQWPLAVHLFEEMLSVGLSPDAITFNTVMHSIKEWNRSLHFLERMMEASVQPNAAVLGTAMKAAKTGKHWPWAVYLLQMLQSSQVQSRQLSFDIPLELCVKAKKWDLALEVLSSMTEADLRPSDRRIQAVIESSALTQGISECAKETRWQEAIMLYASNTNAAGVASFNATMKACQKGTQWQLSTDLLHQITLQKPKPDTISYNTAIDSCEKGHQWPLAVHLFEEMLSVGLSPDAITFNTVMHSIKEWNRSLHFLERMMQASVQPNAAVLGTAMKAAKTGKHWPWAVYLLQMLQSSQVKPRQFDFDIPLGLCVKAKKWDLALEVFSSMTEADFLPSGVSIQAVIQSCDKAQSWQTALYCLHQALNAGTAVQGGTSDRSLLRRLVFATLRKCGSKRKRFVARQLLERITAGQLHCDRKTLELLKARAEEREQHGDQTSVEAPESLEVLCPDPSVEPTPKHLTLRTNRADEILWWLENSVAPELAQRRHSFKCSIGCSDAELREVSSLLRDLGLWATLKAGKPGLQLELTRKDLATLRSCTSKAVELGRLLG